MTGKDKIVVGMSGGVDSSMALGLLKKQGWQPIGVSLKYALWEDPCNLLRENVCCSAESFRIAAKVCQRLKVPYHLLDVSREFKKVVIDYFISELRSHRTPNPCIICNRYLKFKKLFEWAKKHKVKYVATGHYARVGEIKNVRLLATRRSGPARQEKLKMKNYQLLMAKDKNKDQTYSLSFLPQKWLKKIIFPLGDYLKQEIYQKAEEWDFEFFLKRKESQNFCFVAGGKSLKCFLEKEIGQKEGLIKDSRGKVLGKHPGLHFYTRGQRKGIKIPEGPWFVKDFDTAKNILVVTKKTKELLSSKALLSPVHFVSGQLPQRKIAVQAKIRYRQPLAKATLYPLSQGKLRLVFSRPQRAITPGQFAVFYLPGRPASPRGEQADERGVCLGGGRIIDFD